ncbi:MAG: hypothetical protein J6K55_10225 [Clostridia bacterium]|nr:hypothetical protein [Clostridia bacterium]
MWKRTALSDTDAITILERGLEMNKENEYIQIDLLKIFEGIIGRFWMVALCMILCGALLFSYAAFYLSPMYEASVMVYVNNSSFSVGATTFSISASEISAARGLVDTYLVILKTRSTLNEVIRLGELDYTYEQLVGKISAEAVNETEVFSIKVTCGDPYEAEHIANTIARVLPDKIAAIVEGSAARIVDYAVVPSQKVSPSIRKYTLVGLLLGALASCGVIVVIELLDDRIRTENYLLENFSTIPLLSVIPDMLEEKNGGQYYYSKYGRYSRYSKYDGSYEQPKKPKAAAKSTAKKAGGKK